jgi:hypothetical protein
MSTAYKNSQRPTANPHKTHQSDNTTAPYFAHDICCFKNLLKANLMANPLQKQW